MRTYRITTGDGRELATVAARNVVDVIATPAAADAPLYAEIMAGASGRGLARRELSAGTRDGRSYR